MTICSSPGAVEPATSIGHPGAKASSSGRQRRGAQAFEVELGVAGHDDAAWRGAEREETARVVVGLGREQIGASRALREAAGELTVAGERPVGDAAVDDCDTRARAMRLDEIVRPQLGLRDQHQRGPDRVEEGAERAAAVERREQMGPRAGNKRRAASRPAAVIVVTTSLVPGRSRMSAVTTARSAPTSPTDAACAQMRGSAGGAAPSAAHARPNRARRVPASRAPPLSASATGSAGYQSALYK